MVHYIRLLIEKRSSLFLVSLLLCVTGCEVQRSSSCGDFPRTLKISSDQKFKIAVEEFLTARDENLHCALGHVQQNFSDIVDGPLGRRFWTGIRGIGLEILFPRSRALDQEIDGPHGVYLSDKDKEYLKKLVQRSRDRIKDKFESVANSVNISVIQNASYPAELPTNFEEDLLVYGTVDVAVEWLLKLQQQDFDHLFSELKDELDSASWVYRYDNGLPKVSWAAYCNGEYLQIAAGETREIFNDERESVILNFDASVEMPENAFAQPIRRADTVLLKQAIDLIPFGYIRLWLERSGINAHRSVVNKIEPKIIESFSRFCKSTEASDKPE